MYGKITLSIFWRKKNDRNKTETINDKNANISNVWRSIKFDPETTANFCYYPIHHTELTSRKRYIFANYDKLATKLSNDVDYFDPKLAGFWIYAAAISIGPLLNNNQIPCLLYSKGR